MNLKVSYFSSAAALEISSSVWPAFGLLLFHWKYLLGIKGHSNFFELLNKLIHFANLLIKFVFGQAIALNLNKSYQKGAVGGCPEPVN
jgi:hypothetical protein